MAKHKTTDWKKNIFYDCEKKKKNEGSFYLTIVENANSYELNRFSNLI